MHDNTNHSTSHRKPAFEIALAKWIRLAAAPLFFGLACLSMLGPGAEIVCLSASTTFGFHDMGLMYLLMGVVHLPVWLTLVGHGLDREASELRDSNDDAPA